jgi:hypothetical protein
VRRQNAKRHRVSYDCRLPVRAWPDAYIHFGVQRRPGLVSIWCLFLEGTRQIGEDGADVIESD